MSCTINLLFAKVLKEYPKKLKYRMIIREIYILPNILLIVFSSLGVNMRSIGVITKIFKNDFIKINIKGIEETNVVIRVTIFKYLSVNDSTASSNHCPP